jgi:hypothetical protein
MQPSLRGILVKSGADSISSTTRLGRRHLRGATSAKRPAVGGYPVLVEATLADSDLLSIINAVGVVAEARRYLFAVLVPADGYAPQTAHGVLHGFDIQRDGSITFDGSVAGHYVLTTIPRLEIRGATPF